MVKFKVLAGTDPLLRVTDFYFNELSVLKADITAYICASKALYFTCKYMPANGH